MYISSLEWYTSAWMDDPLSFPLAILHCSTKQELSSLTDIFSPLLMSRSVIKAMFFTIYNFNSSNVEPYVALSILLTDVFEQRSTI